MFADRLEIISPGHLPDSLSTDAVRAGASIRRNPTLTEHAVHILPYRGLGTGIPRALHDWPTIELIDDVRGNQFRAVVPRQQPTTSGGNGTPEVTPEVMRMLVAMQGEMRRGEIMAKLGLKDEKHFREHYQQAGVSLGVIEMTIPDKAKSGKQQYRLTEKGTHLLEQQSRAGQDT